MNRLIPGDNRSVRLVQNVDGADMQNPYVQPYGQLCALKHIIYESLTLSDPESLVANVSKQIKKYVDGGTNAIWLKDSRGNFVKTAVDGRLLPSDEREVIQTGSADLPDGVASGRMQDRQPAATAGSQIGEFGVPDSFPFKSEGAISGFLVAGGRNAQDRDIYQLIAHYLGIVLHNSRLHREVEEITELMMTQNEQMSALHHVGIQIAIAPDPAAICKLITDTLVGELGAIRAVALLADDSGTRLLPVSSAGDIESLDSVRLRPGGSGPIPSALDSGRIVTFQGYAETLNIGGRRLKNWSIYPLKAPERGIGIVVAETDETENDDQAAILINHANVVINTLTMLDKVSEEREQLADTLSAIGDGVIATDLRGRITLMNRVAEKLTGWQFPEAKGLFIDEVFCVVDEESLQPSRTSLPKSAQDRSPAEPAYHSLLVSRDGTERPIVKSETPITDTQGRKIGTVDIFKDITDLRRLEQESFKVQKLESLGVMAGGLAHDFNNLLGAILGNISLAQMKLPAGDPAARSLQQAELGVHRAKDLTHKFITFSSGGEPFKMKVMISRVLRDVADLAVSGSNVRCEFDFAQDLRPVEIDQVQISQVFYNIVENAKQAMPSGGVIRISAENCSPEALRTLTGQRAPKSRYVLIRVIDQGMGIQGENLQKIFDPYFSTKGLGAEKGTGLGLTIAHAVIQKHGGRIGAESRPGRGTCMSIYLPTCEPASALTDIQPDVSRRVLFMDDEELLRDLAMKMLAELGYEATLAQDGLEAVTLYTRAMEEGRPFRIVILDLTVPGGMGGEEALKQMRRVDPKVQAIVSSGYASDPLMADSRVAGFAGSLPKPYKIEQLDMVLKSALSPEKGG